MENIKKKFNVDHWEQALAAVYTKAISDAKFRQLCLTDARRAVMEVAPYLELPSDFHVKFVDQSKDLVQSYLLPPTLQDSDPVCQQYAGKVIESLVLSWTNPTTPSQPK